MKRALFLVLALVMCLTLCSCSKEEENEDAVLENTQSSAIEQLTDLEKKLFDNLISIVSADFYDPSAVRVLEICNYKNDVPTLPHTIAVRLQGETITGGTVNNYFLICMKSGEASDADEVLENWASLYDTSHPMYKEQRLINKATEGEYVQLRDDYKSYDDNSDIFNITNINNALKEHWENMGI